MRTRTGLETVVADAQTRVPPGEYYCFGFISRWGVSVLASRRALCVLAASISAGACVAADVPPAALLKVFGKGK